MNEFAASLRFIITVEVLGLVAWPLARHLFSRFPDKGWGLSKFLGILIVTWAVWLLSILRLVPFSRRNTVIVIVAVAAAMWGAQARGGGIVRLARELKEAFVGRRRDYSFILVEAIFVLWFLMWTNLRSARPDINGLEKFMDYGFMLSALKTSWFPPLDHFLAGEAINYYYVGHAMAALLTQVSGVPPGMAYNLQMSNLFALGLIGTFSLGGGLFALASREPAHLLPRLSRAAGLVSAAAVMLIGNLHWLVWRFIQGDKYWYPAATRYISHTIHEYPIYSFVVNDLHAHVADIPNVLLCLALALCIFAGLGESAPQGKLILGVLPQVAVFALSVGACYAVSSWEYPIYLVVFGFTVWLALTLRDGKTPWKPDVLLWTGALSLGVLASSFLLWSPHWFQMVPPPQGWDFVGWGMHSAPWDLAVVWGVQLFFVASYVMYRREAAKRPRVEANAVAPQKGKKRRQAAPPPPPPVTPAGQASAGFPEVMLLVSLILIALPEIIYVKDIYPGDPRSNTVFKLYYQAWIILGAFSGFAAVLVWRGLPIVNKRWSDWYRIGAVIVLLAGGGYSLNAVNSGIGRGVPPFTIDGTAFLEKLLPADAAAIDWLNREVPGQPFIVEGVKESYTLYGRVATFTGFPTVLGWPVHEWLWRGGVDKSMIPQTAVEKKTGQPDTVDQRRKDVQTLYETENAEAAKRIVEKYGVEYIYVGKLEREQYPKLTEAKFSPISSSKIYDHDDVRIYKIK